MVGDKRTYVLGEKSFRRQVGSGMWVGSVFQDHGRTMKLIKVGQRYRDGMQWVIDIEAVEIEKEKARKV